MNTFFNNNYQDNNPYLYGIQKIHTNTTKMNDFMYNVADPPVNLLLRYEIKPTLIKNDCLRNTINRINHIQAETYSMMYNPLYIPNKVTHYKETIADTKKIAEKTKNSLNYFV